MRLLFTIISILLFSSCSVFNRDKSIDLLSHHFYKNIKEASNSQNVSKRAYYLSSASFPQSEVIRIMKGFYKKENDSVKGNSAASKFYTPNLEKRFVSDSTFTSTGQLDDKEIAIVKNGEAIFLKEKSIYDAETAFDKATKHWTIGQEYILIFYSKPFEIEPNVFALLIQEKYSNGAITDPRVCIYKYELGSYKFLETVYDNRMY